MNDYKFDLVAIIAFCVFVVTGLVNAFLMLFFLLPITVAFCIYVEKHKKNYKLSVFSIIDCVFLLFIVVEIVCALKSIYLPNSQLAILKLLSGVLLYFFIRLFVRSGMLKICEIISYMAGLLSVITLIFFYFHQQRYATLGPLEQYKGFYRPLGMLSNDLATLLLCLMPFSVTTIIVKKGMYRWLSLLICCLLVICILFSFSRGAYLALIVFVVSSVFLWFCIAKRNFIKLVFLFSVVFAVSFGSTLGFCGDIATTLQMNKTISQQKSIEGRFFKYKEAISVFDKNKLFGVGGGNYTLAIERYVPSVKEDDFSPRCTNTFFQILVEKGILGAVVFIFFVVCVIIEGFKRLKENWIMAFFVSAIFSLLLRECTFSSLFEVDSIFMLFVIICSIIIHNVDENKMEFSEN